MEPRTTNTFGFVYISGRINGCYKIGKSNDPESRLERVSTLLPMTLKAIHQIASDRPHWLETRLHEAFSPVRQRGEWFKLTKLDLRLLKCIVHADGPDDLPACLRPACPRPARVQRVKSVARVARQTEYAKHRERETLIARCPLKAFRVGPQGIALVGGAADAAPYAADCVLTTRHYRDPYDDEQDYEADGSVKILLMERSDGAFYLLPITEYDAESEGHRHRGIVTGVVTLDQLPANCPSEHGHRFSLAELLRSS